MLNTEWSSLLNLITMPGRSCVAAIMEKTQFIKRLELGSSRTGLNAGVCGHAPHAGKIDHRGFLSLAIRVSQPAARGRLPDDHALVSVPARQLHARFEFWDECQATQDE